MTEREKSAFRTRSAAGIPQFGVADGFVRPSPAAEDSRPVSRSTSLPSHGKSVLALIVLHHPDLRRVGQRVLLPELSDGKSVALSRLVPVFSTVHGVQQGPLDDLRLSRQPLWLSPAEYGGVRLQADLARVQYTVHGRPGTGQDTLTAAEVAHGVLLTVADTVMLMLRPVDAQLARELDHGMVGLSDVVERLRRDVVRVAQVDVPVLIRGETGVGKERIARAIHMASGRADKPFVAVNVAALSPAAATSELFGHRRGAFTDAVANHPGYFGSADGGTLFLDEIGEAPPAVQTLLLRALDEGQIQPVGGLPKTVNVRLIAATDADLETEVARGRFRDALLHRIRVFTFDVPPLRQRREDISTLLLHFLEEQLKALNATALLTPPGGDAEPWLPLHVVQELTCYDWPGNVRQLRNIATELAIRGRESAAAQVPPSLYGVARWRRRPSSGEHPHTRSTDLPQPEAPGAPHSYTARHAETQRIPRAQAEPPSALTHAAQHAMQALVDGRRVPPSLLSDAEIAQALRRHEWNIAATAKYLRIAKNSLIARMQYIDGVRRAVDLTPSDIEDARREAGNNTRAMAMLLHAGERALVLRLREIQALLCPHRDGALCDPTCPGPDSQYPACGGARAAGPR